jgi:hypothetical protein
LLILTRLPIKLLLRIHLTSLHASRASINVRLPGWSTEVLETARRSVIENLFYFFKRFLAGLGEEEEHVEKHCYAEDAENDVDFPSDVGECRWDEVGESEVECPDGEVSNCS